MAHWLHKLGLAGLAALLLEGAGPLTYIGAQISYMADPLLHGTGLPLDELGRLLEDPDQVRSLVHRLEATEITE